MTNRVNIRFDYFSSFSNVSAGLIRSQQAITPMSCQQNSSELHLAHVSRFNQVVKIVFVIPSGKGRTIRKVMGWEGNFRAARIFFRYQILCMNFI